MGRKEVKLVRKEIRVRKLHRVCYETNIEKKLGFENVIMVRKIIA